MRRQMQRLEWWAAKQGKTQAPPAGRARGPTPRKRSTAGFGQCERTNFYHFQPPGLWQFVPAASRDQSRPLHWVSAHLLLSTISIFIFTDEEDRAIEVKWHGSQSQSGAELRFKTRVQQTFTETRLLRPARVRLWVNKVWDLPWGAFREHTSLNQSPRSSLCMCCENRLISSTIHTRQLFLPPFTVQPREPACHETI